MESTVFYKTRSGNLYLYDSNTSTFMASHPLFEYFYECDKTGVVSYSNGNPNEENNGILGKNNYSLQEIEYYHKKFKFLKTNGFFGLITNHQRIKKDINPEMIAYYMANIKQVTFEVTESCNLNCKYCTYNNLFQESENRVNMNLDLNSSKALIDFMFSHWNSKMNQNTDQTVIISFYGGEPLLNFIFIQEIITYIQGKPKGMKNFRYTITTNGLLLDKHIDYLIKNDFNITISLDGSFENNQYRIDHNNKNPHEKIVSSIKKIMKNNPSFFKKNITFNTVLHDKNSVEDVYNYFTKEFDKPTRFLGLNTVVISAAAIDGSSPENEIIERAYSNFIDAFDNGVVNTFFSSNQHTDLFPELNNFPNVVSKLSASELLIHHDFGDDGLDYYICLPDTINFLSDWIGSEECVFVIDNQTN